METVLRIQLADLKTMRVRCKTCAHSFEVDTSIEAVLPSPITCPGCDGNPVLIASELDGTPLSKFLKYFGLLRDSTPVEVTFELPAPSNRAEGAL